MVRTKDNSPENKIKIATEKLIMAARKLVQSATPIEALEIWKFVKTQQLKRIPGLTAEQIQTLIETQAKEMGAEYILTELASTKHQEKETDPPAFVDEMMPTVAAVNISSNESVTNISENGVKPKTGVASSKSR
jgi:phosphopantetheine adenylyltransferase